MEAKNMLIAIDGPAASGKGTIAKLLSEKLSLPVLHTGNIYRAIAFRVLSKNIDVNNIKEVTKEAENLLVEELNNPQLNEEKVGEWASKIAVYTEVREATFSFQRDFIEKEQSAIIEGRDIGTVICPEADFKFYITADVEVRARRRANQHHDADYEKILADLKLRDERDQNRISAPLKPADDAIIIDSSNLNVNETLEKIIYYISF